MVGEQVNLSDKVVVTYVIALSFYLALAWLLHGETEEDKGKSYVG
jgi:hypothetical protein